MVKFCDECKSVLTPSTHSDELLFHCRCSKILPSEPEDTLRSEKYTEAAQSNLKFEVFIEDSPYDAAGKKVAKECPKCKLPFMTMIYVGTSQTVLYTCVCGNRVTNEDFKGQVRKKHEKSMADSS